MHEVLVNRLGGLSLPRKSVVRLTDRPDMTLDVYRGRKTTMQCNVFDIIDSCSAVFILAIKKNLQIQAFYNLTTIVPVQGIVLFNFVLGVIFFFLFIFL